MNFCKLLCLWYKFFSVFFIIVIKSSLYNGGGAFWNQVVNESKERSSWRELMYCVGVVCTSSGKSVDDAFVDNKNDHLISNLSYYWFSPQPALFCGLSLNLLEGSIAMNRECLCIWEWESMYYFVSFINWSVFIIYSEKTLFLNYACTRWYRLHHRVRFLMMHFSIIRIITWFWTSYMT